MVRLRQQVRVSEQVAMNRLRFTGEWPPQRYWKRYPNWEYTWDVQSSDGGYESSLRPAKDQTCISKDTAVTTGDVHFADGRKMPALLEVTDGHIHAINVFPPNMDGWRVYFSYPDRKWEPFVEEGCSSESEMWSAVSMDDPAIFPLTICSRLQDQFTGEHNRFVIYPDGKARQAR